jgi:hypothetical protein
MNSEDGLAAMVTSDSLVCFAEPAILEWRSRIAGTGYSSAVTTSRHSHMRELRAQHRGRPYRVLYAFDPRRTAILLLGGDKTGDDRWYEVNVPKADATYDQYLAELKKEGLI